MSDSGLSDRLRAVLTDAPPVEALGALEVLRAELLTRLVRSQPNGPTHDDAGDDRPLTAAEVAELLNVSPRFVYDHAEELGGVRISERALRFPASAVDRYLRRRARRAESRR